MELKMSYKEAISFLKNFLDESLLNKIGIRCYIDEEGKSLPITDKESFIIELAEITKKGKLDELYFKLQEDLEFTEERLKELRKELKNYIDDDPYMYDLTLVDIDYYKVYKKELIDIIDIVDKLKFAVNQQKQNNNEQQEAVAPLL